MPTVRIVSHLPCGESSSSPPSSPFSPRKLSDVKEGGKGCKSLASLTGLGRKKGIRSSLVLRSFEVSCSIQYTHGGIEIRCVIEIWAQKNPKSVRILERS